MSTFLTWSSASTADRARSRSLSAATRSYSRLVSYKLLRNLNTYKTFLDVWYSLYIDKKNVSFDNCLKLSLFLSPVSACLAPCLPVSHSLRFVYISFIYLSVIYLIIYLSSIYLYFHQSFHLWLNRLPEPRPGEDPRSCRQPPRRDGQGLCRWYPRDI